MFDLIPQQGRFARPKKQGCSFSGETRNRSNPIVAANSSRLLDRNETWVSVNVPEKMQVGSRLWRFAFNVSESLHARKVLRAEQRLLTFLAKKEDFGPRGNSSAALWVEHMQASNLRRADEIEAQKIYKMGATLLFIFKCLPPVVRRWIKWTAHFLSGLLRPGKSTSTNETSGPANGYAIAVPFDNRPIPPVLSDPIGVVAHIFYPDVVDEIRRYLEHIPGTVDLYLSTDSSAKKALIQRDFANWPKGKVEVRVAPNRGRDIAPKLITFRDVYDRHPIVLHLHSKKTPHESLVRMWRLFIFENLMGDEAVVSNILDAFAHNPSIGMIASDHYNPVKISISWGVNLPPAQILGQRMGIRITPDSPLDFPAGSMFWARSAALRPLLDLNLSAHDFPIEAGQRDGTLAHAIERLYFYACEMAGLKWIKVCRPELVYERGVALTHIADEVDIVEYLENKAAVLGPVIEAPGP